MHLHTAKNWAPLTSTVVPTPRVVVSFSKDGKDAPLAFRRELGEAADRVRELLEARGLEVRIVNAAHPEIDAREAVASAAGVVVLGGADIDPAVYGQELQADNLYYVDTAADEFEVGLVRCATEQGKPVFGICRGSQILNVALGGTLIQDLGPGLHNAEITGNPWRDHDVEVTEGSLLQRVVGADRITVRTGHHQAVETLGAGLRVAARADDGVIEATEGAEAAGPWMLGVQWHPEEGQGDPIALARFFDGYAEAVRSVEE